MKKGFTLIELIMVIVVLALLALVAIPSVNSVIKNSREKTYDEQINRIETVTKSYMTNSKRSLSLPSTASDGKVNSCYVAVDVLKKVGLLSLDDIKDPRKGKDDINGYVVISNQSGKFKYEYTDLITGNVPMCYDEGDIDDDTTLNVVYDCGANGGVCSNGVKKVTKRLKLSDALREAPSSPSKEAFDFEGWNVKKDAREKLRTLNASDVKGSGKTITLYALYKKDASVRFHYYDSSSNSIAVATSTCYVYSDNDDSCSFNTPAKVSSSTTKYGSSFVGLAVEPESMIAVDKNNLKIGTDYYALYSKKLTYYYYNDTAYVKGTLYRNEFINNSDQITTVVSDDVSGISNATFSNSKGPGGSAFAGVSASANVSNIITDINKVALSDMSLLYSVYRFNVSFMPGKNVSSVGMSEGSCDTTYNSMTCKVNAPSVTPASGYTFLGWSSRFDGGDEVSASDFKVSANNQKFYAIASDQTIPSITSFTATNITTRSITLNATAYAASGITKYEFSMDGGVTWIDGGVNNVYTFDGLKQGTNYNFIVRVTSGANLKNTRGLSAVTKTISNPVFDEICNNGNFLNIKITYPDGCGTNFTCSYKASNLSNSVTEKSTSLNLDGFGVLNAVVSDGVNNVTFAYEYYKKTLTSDVVMQNTTNTNNDDYRYTGKDVNNYVTFNGELWRVIGIVDGKVKLIKATSIGTMAWSSTVNNWSSASLKEHLNNEYYNGLSEKTRDMIASSVWYLGGSSNSNLTRSEFYSAERDASSVYKGNSTSFNAYVGLMYPSDYGYASSAAICADTVLYNYDTSSHCYESNWLYSAQDEWLQAPYSNGSKNVYIISKGNGYVYYKSCSTGSVNVRPSVYLKNDVYITGGNGSKSKPYSLDVINNKVCAAIDNRIPDLSLSASKTSNSITVVALASATSGISKYEFSVDNGKTWIDNKTDNVYTFSGLTQNTSYKIMGRVTSGAGMQNTASITVKTDAIEKPTFTEDENGEVKITYPDGCGTKYTCLYKKDGSDVVVTSKSNMVYFKYDGSVTAEITDGTNSVSGSYTVFRTELYINSKDDDATGYCTINKPCATLNQANSSAHTSATIYLKSDIVQNSAVVTNKNLILTSSDGKKYSLIRSQEYASSMIQTASGTLMTKNIVFDGKNFKSKAPAMFVTGANVTLSTGTTFQNFNNISVKGDGRYGVVTTDDNKTAILNIDGATFTNNKGVRDVAVHGGVYSTVNMKSGTIKKNTAFEANPGITVWGNLNMMGGTITSNTSDDDDYDSGGITVYCATSGDIIGCGTFRFSGGNVTGNEVNDNQYYQNTNIFISDGATVIDDKLGFSYVQGGQYHILSYLNTSYGLDVVDGNTYNGSRVQLYTNNSNDQQKWQPRVISIVDNVPRYSFKVSHANDLWLWVDDNSSDSGASAVVYGIHSNLGGYWNLEKADNGVYYIRSILGTCLDVPGGNVANGQLISTYTCNSTSAQKWKFVALS